MSEMESMIGDPDIQAEFNEQQILDDNCAVCAETSIINQFHPELNLDQASAAYISAENGWYEPGEGTGADEIGNLMDAYDIENHTVTNATVEQLAYELQQGHGIIVGVNSSELWNEGPLAELQNFICDALGIDNSIFLPANHAVTVTGFDLSDPSNPQVILNDSGVPDGAAVSYPLSKFLDAWQNSDFQYTATNDPLPTLINAGIESPNFWDNFSWANWIGLGAGTLTALVTAINTGDVNLALGGGIFTGNAVSDFFESETFARLI